MNAVVQQPVPLTSITEYSQTAAALAQLREQYAGVVFNVAIPKEMEHARKARMELRTLRTDLDKMRLRLNEDDHARIKARNDEAKRITAELAALEDPIDETIKAEEGRKERERKEREETERKRISEIHAEIASVSAIPAQSIGLRADELKAKLEQLRGRDWLTDPGEFEATADDAKGRAIAVLDEMYSSAQAKEIALKRAEEERAAEERRFQEERAAFERERDAQKKREAEARAKAEAEEQIRQGEEAKRRAALEEEERQARARIAAEEAAARAKREEEARLADAERQRILQAESEERARREAEDRAAAALRRQEEERLQAEREKIDAQQREIERQRVELLDGAELLKNFVTRFGRRREFAVVTKAIKEYLGAQQ